MRTLTPIIAALLVLLAISLIFFSKKSQPRSQARHPSRAALSLLAETPDWPSLEKYQHSITCSDFEKLLTEIFTTDDTWREFIEINQSHASIITGAAPFILHFATSENFQPAPRYWNALTSLPVPSADKPLANLNIAIDPGHIGGQWAKIEERWFQIGHETPVVEGDMTLHVAKLLKPLLEEMGAKVSLVRSNSEPVTSLRPDELITLAPSENSSDPLSQRKFSEKLFYRTAEIRARAKLVNEHIKPDLVLCLHFNAEGWGDPAQPTLTPRSHFHILLNGAYTSDEIRLADQRFAMLEKLLQRTHEEEALIGKTVADTFAELSKLPPYFYPPLSNNVRNISGHPYLYSRNLLANRLYRCPVIFMEPYVMNSTIDYARIQAGDYQGTREINGQQVPSLFKEYAQSLAQALAKHYKPAASH
jgi:N-acetylmuramoyl-L-alanine amidase